MHASRYFSIEVYICFNGTTDNSRQLVETWISRQQKLKPCLLVLPEANLVEAQRLVIQHASRRNKFFGFFDADIILNKDAITLLARQLEADNSCIVVYARSVAIPRSRLTITERIMNLYDSRECIYSRRKYLHGRAFMTTDWSIPRCDPVLCVDDIYLSFYYLTKYGRDSIRYVPEAQVSFRQIRTFSDYYRVYRRRNIEVRKCLGLFPEFLALPKDQVNRQLQWRKLWMAPIGTKALWLLFFLYRWVAKVCFAIETRSFSRHSGQWKDSITSKRTRLLPFLVLIEGYDFSDRERVANMLHQCLSRLGISSELNTGPLGPRWYRKFYQLVSSNSYADAVRRLVYRLEIMIGSRTARTHQSDVVIQISSIVRYEAYAVASGHHLELVAYRLFSRRLPKYDLSVFLNENRDGTMFGSNSFRSNLLVLMRKRLPMAMYFNISSMSVEKIAERLASVIRTHL